MKHYVLVEIDTTASDREVSAQQRAVMRGVRREFGDYLARYWAVTPLGDQPVGVRGGMEFQLSPELRYDAVLDDGNPPPGYTPKFKERRPE